MAGDRQISDIAVIVKKLEKLFEDQLNNLPVKRNDQQSASCRILFSHNIRYLTYHMKGDSYLN